MFLYFLVKDMKTLRIFDFMGDLGDESHGFNMGKGLELPSGKLTKPQFFEGQLTVSMVIFNSELLNYQRVH